MLSFASIWALEELALQELQNEIRFHSLFSITANRKLTSSSEVDKAALIQYEPVGHILVIEGEISQASETAIARVVRDYLEKHKSDDLLEAPRLRQIATVSAENFCVEKDEPRVPDEDAVPALIPSNDNPAETNVVQKWLPASNALKYFESDEFKILPYIAGSTATEIVSEKAAAKGFLTIRGSTYGEVQQAIEKLAVLQPALALIETAHYANMVIATGSQTQTYHMMLYAGINPTNLRRLLFDPALIPLSRILTLRAPITWTYLIDEERWAMLDHFCNPPNLKTAWKNGPETTQAWKTFVFKQLGVRRPYTSFPLSAFHPPRAPLDERTNANIASKHPFLNPEKAKEVNKWVAQDEGATSPSGALPRQIDLSALGPPSSSVTPPELPAIQRDKTSNLRKAPVAGIKRRVPLKIDNDGVQSTSSSTVQPDPVQQGPIQSDTVQPDDASTASSVSSPTTDPLTSIEKDDTSSNVSTKLEPTSNFSQSTSAPSRALTNLQTVQTENPKDKISGIYHEEIPFKTSAVGSVTSKQISGDLIDLSWEPEVQQELLISDIELISEKLGSSPKPEAEMVKDIRPSGSSVPRGQVFCEVGAGKGIEKSRTLLLGVSNPSALKRLGASQDTDLTSLVSKKETARFADDLPKDSIVRHSVSGQTECEESSMNIRDNGPQSGGRASANKKSELLRHTGVPLYNSLPTSPGVTNGLFKSGSVAREYLLNLCSGGAHPDRNCSSIGLDGSVDDIPRLRLPHFPADASIAHGKGNTIELCRKYAQAARAKHRNNQRILLEDLKSKQLEQQPSLQTETPGKEGTLSSESEQIKDLFRSLNPILEPAICWPGPLTLEIQLGLMLLPAGPKKSQTLKLELDGLKRFHAPHDGLAAPSVTFLGRLTTCPVDIDHIIDLQVNNRRLFQKDSYSFYPPVLFEFHCESGSSKFIITVFENGSHMIGQPETLLGAVYLNFPSRIWDAALKIGGQINQLTELDKETQKAALSIVENLWVEPNRSRVRLLTCQPKNLKITKILMKRSTEHQHLQSEYPEGSEEMYLRVCETQDLIIQVTDLDDQVIQAHCSSLSEMTKENRQWWTASLVSPILNSILSFNKYIKPGEKATDWTPTDLFGNDARFLLPPLSEPTAATSSATHAEGFASTRLSGVATAIGGTGIGGLVRLTETVVDRIDAVGWNNNGPASEVNKASSSYAGVSDSITITGDNGKVAMAKQDRLEVAPIGRNPFAPMPENSFW